MCEVLPSEATMRFLQRVKTLENGRPRWHCLRRALLFPVEVRETCFPNKLIADKQIAALENWCPWRR